MTATAQPLSLSDLVAQRERFGAYARLVQVIAEAGNRIRPDLDHLRDTLDRDIAPHLCPAGNEGADADADVRELLESVHALLDSPARMIDSLAASLVRHRALLPDLFPSPSTAASAGHADHTDRDGPDTERVADESAGAPDPDVNAAD